MKSKNARYELNKTKFLNPDEQTELNRILTKYADTDPRDTTLIWMLLHTGARASELLAITPNDLDPREKTVFIRGLKDSDNREIPLPPWLFKKLDAISPEDPFERIFDFTYNRLRQIWVLYRPVKKKVHSLRHTFALNVYQRSKDILGLKTALGHRSLVNTMIYADFQYKTAELRRCILG